ARWHGGCDNGCLMDRGAYPARGAVLAAGCALISCSSAPQPAQERSPARNPPAATVTFHKDVEPILQRSCQGCHVTGGIAPFALVTYDQARVVAGAMVTETASRAMPPWHALTTAECAPPFGWKRDLRLTDEEIATIARWRDADAPEGDPK